MGEGEEESENIAWDKQRKQQHKHRGSRVQLALGAALGISPLSLGCGN